jgi:hypothetical protein
VSALRRNHCPESAGISVRFTQESLSGLGKNMHSDKGKIRIAKGQLYMKTEIAPLNGLNAFYELKTDQRTIDLIQETLSNKNFDSTYNSHWQPRCCYFLYKTSNNEERIITFGTDDDTPNELDFLMQQLNVLVLTETQNKLKLKKPFSVDSMVVDIEKKIFSKYPPLPKPEVE